MATKHDVYRKEKEDKGLVGWESPVAIHPGEILSDFLEEYDITQVELAQRLGINKKTVNEIITGVNPVTHDTAYKLEKVFEEPASFWIRLQTMYEADVARLEAEARIKQDIEEYANDKVKETYKELVKNKLVKRYSWIEKNLKDIFFELQKYYGADSLGFVGNFSGVALRKYKKDVNEYTLAAWLRLGERKSYEIDTAPFDKKKLKESLGDIRELSLLQPKEYLSKLEKLLANCGVVLVCAPGFKNTHAQGAAEWIAPDKAMIILKSTKQGEDRFWFNLFHEIGHLLLHSKKEAYVDFDENGSRTEEELEADEFAQKNLIPDFNKYMGDSDDLEEIIQKISRSVSVARSVVAGRIAYEFKNAGNVAWKVTSKYIPQINYTNI